MVAFSIIKGGIYMWDKGPDTLSHSTLILNSMLYFVNNVV